MSDVDDEHADGFGIVWPLERLSRIMRAREHEDGLNPAQREALRYLSRANRFSNSPGSLTRYLSATKGTISQTLISLERKGFITKAARGGTRRSVALTLTPKGYEALARDPWAQLAGAAADLGGKTRRRLSKGLRELLAVEVKRGNLTGFGACPNCRYFREKGREADANGPHLCMYFEQPLAQPETALLCIAHEAR